MNFKFCSLSSGSSGNCQYIETNKSRILIDAGFSGKRVEMLLDSIDIAPNTIDAIFVTHEHIDHAKGVGVLSRRYNIPIYANENTFLGMKKIIGKLKEENIKIFKTGENIEFKDLNIHPFHTFHDALEPVGYSINYKNKKISIITDTGWVNNEMIDTIKGSNLYFLESNHDIDMLKLGNYPYYLKQRIMSEKGHLSNEDAAMLLCDVLKKEKEVVLLCHLSNDNNIPSLALQTVTQTLKEKGIDVLKDLNLGLSHRDRATEVFSV